MPKIISYTPPWLSRPSPGYHLFSKSSTSQQINGNASKRQNGAKIAKPFTGNRRTIAKRGTETFVVVENEIRWSDLCMLRDIWEETEKKRKKSERNPDKRDETNGDFDIVDEDDAKVGYRVGGCLYSQGAKSNVLMIDLGSQNFNQRTDPTAFNISQWQFTRHLNVTYRSRSHTSQLVISWSC